MNSVCVSVGFSAENVVILCQLFRFFIIVNRIIIFNDMILDISNKKSFIEFVQIEIDKFCKKCALLSTYGAAVSRTA